VVGRFVLSYLARWLKTAAASAVVDAHQLGGVLPVGRRRQCRRATHGDPRMPHTVVENLVKTFQVAKCQPGRGVRQGACPTSYPLGAPQNRPASNRQTNEPTETVSARARWVTYQGLQPLGASLVRPTCASNSSNSSPAVAQMSRARPRSRAAVTVSGGSVAAASLCVCEGDGGTGLGAGHPPTKRDTPPKHRRQRDDLASRLPVCPACPAPVIIAQRIPPW
jgi:hypothetical protein